MGDRSNVVVEENTYARGEDGKWQLDGTRRVYLYGHWMGEANVTHALVGLKSGRGNDGSYLARVIFCSMVRDDIDGETGYGISGALTDNEHPIVVINADDRKVWIEKESGEAVCPKVDYGTFIDAAEATRDVRREGYWGARIATRLREKVAA